MSARGVPFAITPAQRKHHLVAKSDRALMELAEEIEETWEGPFVCETHKAWDAIHRCLTDGTLLYVSRAYPLNHCVCGGVSSFAAGIPITRLSASQRPSRASGEFVPFSAVFAPEVRTATRRLAYA